MAPVSLASTSLNGGETTTNGVYTNGHAVNGHHAVKKPRQDGFGTRAIHVGSEANPETGAVIPPISLSTTYKQSGIGIHKVRRTARS